MERKNIRQKIALLFVMSFVLLSIWGMTPVDKISLHGMQSTELTKVQINEENCEIIRYENAKGKVTNAANLGYAYQIKTKNEAGQIVKEEFFAADDSLAVLNSGYSSIQYSYVEDYVLLQYLNADGNPVRTLSGYSALKRKKDDAGRTLEDLYLDEKMYPVACTGGYFGVLNEYNEQGKLSKVTYIDKNCKPMKCSGGYAAISYQYFDGKTDVQTQFLDVNGNPAVSNMGHYGDYVLKDELGRNIKVTSLNENGELIAHAWLKCGEYFVSGQSGYEQFTVTSTFCD